MELPGIDLNNTSVIEAMPREQLEHTCVDLAKKLVRGIEICDRMCETIKWLGKSTIMLAELVKEHVPELEAEAAEIIIKAKMMSQE